MKYIAFDNKLVAKSRLHLEARYYGDFNRELVWKGLVYDVRPNGKVIVGVKDTLIEKFRPAVQNALHDAPAEALANPIGRIKCMAKV